MAIINPTGAGAWIKKRSTAPASSTTVIDTRSLAGFHSIKYIFSVYNEIEVKTRTFELLVNREGTSLKDSLYSKLGSPLNLSVNANVNGTLLEIEFINSETFNLDVIYAYVSL